jgi:hypothetical protein
MTCCAEKREIFFRGVVVCNRGELGLVRKGEIREERVGRKGIY